MKPLFSKQQVHERIAEMAKEISRDYAGKDLLLVGLLKGCTIFMSHLLVQLEIEKVEIDFMTVSSYKKGTKSDDFKFVQDLDTSVKDRDVLIVEDIVDSGRTLAFTIAHLESLGARSVETAVFVNKTTNISHTFKTPKYTGFEYHDTPFIVGFGFDLGGYYRNLPSVFQLEEADLEKASAEQ